MAVLTKKLYEVSSKWGNTGIEILTCDGQRFDGNLQITFSTTASFKKDLPAQLDKIKEKLSVLETFRPKKIYVSAPVYHALFPVGAKEVLEKALQLVIDHHYSLEPALKEAKRLLDYTD